MIIQSLNKVAVYCLAQCGKNAFSVSVAPQQVYRLHTSIESQFSAFNILAFGEKQLQCLIQTVCCIRIVMPPHTFPQKQHRPDTRTVRFHHVGVIGITDVDNLTRCAAADPQGIVKYSQ